MNSCFDLNGKTILVTGASSGIGRATCMAVASNGGQVVATGRDKQRLQETLQALEGNGHQSSIADLTHAQEVEALLQKIPSINGVVHAAGLGKIIPFKLISDTDLKAIQLINYEAPVMLTKKLFEKKLLAKGASIVFVASLTGLTGSKGYSLYAGTKGGLIALSRCLALEIAPQGMRVNCLAPGMVKSPMASEVEDLISSDAMNKHEKDYPLGFGELNDVANASVFLLSEASRWITGTTLTLDGGYSCH